MFLRIINRIEEAVIRILLVLITLLVFVDVVMRFGFHAGGSYGLKVGSHFGMDAFVKLFQPVGRRVLSGIAALLALVYCGLVLAGSYNYLLKMKKIGILMEDLPIPIWVANSMLMVGFVFLTVRLLILLWALVTGKADGFRHSDEAKESMALAENTIREGDKL